MYLNYIVPLKVVLEYLEMVEKELQSMVALRQKNAELYLELVRKLWLNLEREGDYIVVSQVKAMYEGFPEERYAGIRAEEFYERLLDGAIEFAREFAA